MKTLRIMSTILVMLISACNEQNTPEGQTNQKINKQGWINKIIYSIDNYYGESHQDFIISRDSIYMNKSFVLHNRGIDSNYSNKFKLEQNDLNSIENSDEWSDFFKLKNNYEDNDTMKVEDADYITIEVLTGESNKKVRFYSTVVSDRNVNRIETLFKINKLLINIINKYE